MKTDIVLKKGLAVSSKILPRLSSNSLRKFGWSVVRAVIVIGLCFIILYPQFVRVSVTFMSEPDLFDVSVRYIPRNPSLDNLTWVWASMQYPLAFFNSFKLSMLTSIMQLASCLVIGYGFARFHFKGRGLLFSLVLITMIVPPQTLMTPLFLHFRFFDLFGIIKLITGKPGINLLDTYWPFAIMSATGMGLKNGLYIYTIRQFFRGMPRELEEAAYVDGAGMFRTFYQIMLPSAKAVMVTVFLFSFVWQWTDTFYSTLFLQKLRVLPAALSTAVSQLGRVEDGIPVMISPPLQSALFNAGSLLLITPLIILYLFAQKSFVESVERTGLVG